MCDYVPGTKIEKPTVSGPIDGNAYSVMGVVARTLREAGCGPEVIAEYRAKATSGDYDNLLRVSMEYADLDV